MKPNLCSLLTIIVFFFSCCTSILAQDQGPSVYTDRKDYSPGDSVLIHGDGWLAGERVELNIEHSMVSYGYYTFYATADSDGHFNNKEMVMQPFHKAESFILTATGIGSGIVAQTRFTDGTFNSRINGDWSSVETWTVSRTGTISTNNASVIVSGNATKFLSELSIGDILTAADDVSVIGKVKSIESDLLLTLEANAAQSSNEGGINYAARKVPGAEDNVVINYHTVTLNQSASCLSLNLNVGSTLSVGQNTSLVVREDLITQNVSDASSTARITGLGTLNTKNIIIGNNSYISKVATYTHKLISTISYLNILENVTINSFMWTYNSRLSNGQLFINTGIVTIGGSIYTINGNENNISTFSIILDPADTRLLLYGCPDPFKLDKLGTSRILLHGSTTVVGYVGNGNQNVYKGSQYKNIILGGSGIKNISNIYINSKLTMQGAATASGITPPDYTATSELEYNGTVAQTAGPEFTTSIPKLTINNALGVSIASDKMVTSRLALINGVLHTGVFTLRLGGIGSIVDASDKSYVSGKLEMPCATTGIKTFPIGKGGTYRPVRLELTSLSGPCNIMVEQLEEPLMGTLPPNITLFPDRYWNISQRGTASLTYNLTLDGTSLPRNDYAFILKRNDPIVVYDAAVNGNNYTIKELDSFGDFGLGYKRLNIQTTALVADAVTTYGNSSVDLLATVRGEDGTVPEGGTVTFSLQNYPVEGANSIIGTAPVGMGGVAALFYSPNKLNADSYTVVARYSGYGLYEASSSDQDISGSNGKLIIEARSITVAADAKSKIYGDCDPELTYTVTAGSLVGGDNFTGKLAREAGELVGAYSIQLGDLTLNSNYALCFKEAELIIEKRSITVMAQAQRKVYGNSDPTLTYVRSSGNLVGEDIFRGMFSRAVGEDVGSYIINQGTFTAGDNYELSFIGSSLTIEPAPATIHITDIYRTYNGTAQGVTVKTTPIGVEVAVTYDGGVVIPVDAGSYAVEAVLANSNYKLVDDLGADLLKQAGVLVISPRTLTIIVNNRSKVYGTENPVLDGTESGLVSSDGIFVSYGTSAQTTSDVGGYEIIATISDPNSKLGNYSVTNTAAKLTITPAPAIITLTNLNLTYDGTPKFATAIADPVAAGTNVKYFQGGNEVAVPIAAGSYAIEVVLINNNYAAEPVSSTLMINKALTRTMVNVNSTIYDGKPNGGTASVSGDGGLNQTLTVSYTGTTKAGSPYKGSEAPTEAGDYAAVASYEESDNYLGSFDSQVFSITQAPGTITLTDLEKVYNGTAQGATVITTPADLSVNVTYNGSSSVPIHAGFYAVEAVLDNSNYIVAIGTGTLTIAKKPLTVTAADKIKVYGDPLPALSGTLSGNVAGDEITVSYSTTAVQNSDVVPSGYPITAALFDPKNRMENYRVINTPGVLIITPAPATISVTGLSKTYNGQPQAPMVTTLPEGLTVNVTYDGSFTVPTNAGSYVVVVALNNANYSATNGTGTLVIDKADQEMFWETPDPITYGAALDSIQMNARVIGIEGGSAPGALTYIPDAGMILNAGRYVLNVAAAATDNYKAAIKTVMLVVNKANQAINFAPLDGKTYGDPSFNVSAETSSGRAVSFSIVSGPATINGNTIAITGAGDVVVRASQIGDGNYNPAADVDRTFTVQKATATVTLGGLSQTYDGSVKEVVFTLYPSGLSGVNIIYQQEGVPVTAPINAGTYQVTATLNHINYQATPATSTLEIDKAATVTTITVSDKVYTSNPHGGTAAVTGAADLNQTLSISYTGATMAGVLYSSNEPPTEAGEYIAAASYAESNNYLGSSSSKAFVINKAVSTVSVEYESALFNGSPHRATAIVSGVDDVISDAVVTYFYVGTPNGAPANSYNSTDAPTLAGSYTVNARFAGNYNYNGDDATKTIRIYAIPTVSLSSPSPAAINNISSIKATIGHDVQNVKWFFTSDPSITTGNTQNSQELNIKSSVPNVYSVYVTFEDGLGKSGYVSANVYAVFFDPGAGFVTGGGWISSPEGAYTPNTTLAGKANFGFVSKFEKGKTIPTGNTEFQFQAGGMNFKSNEYEYLVVAGARAQFKGKGTINGIGNFGFMLSAVDENLLGSLSPDKFRIKIWDNNDGGKVVYDNQIDATEDVLPTTVIGGGSIVIHTPGGGSKKANAIAADAYEHELAGPAKFILKAFPNPSVSKFNLRLESNHAEDKIILRIVDLNGRTIEVINNASLGETYSVGANYRPGVYLVEMIQGSRRSQAMLLKVAD